jgi:hypothetical protein
MFMTRLQVPLATPDISALAKTLKGFLHERHAAGKPPPGHVELLNLLARAAGLRNFATLKAASLSAAAHGSAAAGAVLAGRAARKSSAIDLGTLSPLVRKTLMQFDEAHRLVRLPNKLSVQQMAMWALWTHFAARRSYTEKEVNAILNAHHVFGDPATLRREMVEMKLLGRLDDCSKYWKEARRPDADVRSFLQAWRAGMR